MSELVPMNDIERIVGAKRQNILHLARYVSDQGRLYLLHSSRCKDSGIDLRDCVFSKTMDKGFDPDLWYAYRDQVIQPMVVNGRLEPLYVLYFPEFP